MLKNRYLKYMDNAIVTLVAVAVLVCALFLGHIVTRAGGLRDPKPAPMATPVDVTAEPQPNDTIVPKPDPRNPEQ